MADSKSTKPVFAPAWLKFSSQNNKLSKPTFSHSTTSLSDSKSPLTRTLSAKTSEFGSEQKRSFRSRREGDDGRSRTYYNTLQRQYSFEYYYDNTGPSRSGVRQRLHSIDDYYNQHYHYQYPDSQQLTSQRFGNYHNSLSRSSKYDTYDSCSNDLYNGYSYPTPRRFTPRQDLDIRHPQKNKILNEDAKISKSTSAVADFNDEFPSLNGQHEENCTSHKLTNGSGVWDKPPRNGSVMENHNEECDVLKESPSKISSLYKLLIPQKNVLPKKSGMRFAGLQPGLDSTRSSNETEARSPSHPVEILNPKLAIYSRGKDRNREDKSEFLKTLRNDATNSVANDVKPGVNQESKSSGPNIDGEVQCSDGDAGELNTIHLSSSLEAEQRLLREMGWTESDNEDYVITEADMREFQSLSKQMQSNHVKVTPVIPKSWGLSRVSTNQVQVDDEGAYTSTSDSDDSC